MHTSGASHGGGHQQNKKQGGIDIWEVREIFCMHVFLKFGQKVSMALDKGQVISKCILGVFNFFHKNTSHSSKNEFVCLFFGRIHGLTIYF